MERVQSLIHKIKFQYETGATPDDLLQTLEQMRHELVQQQIPADHTRHAVAVMLPPGYRTPVPPPSANVTIPPNTERVSEEIKEIPQRTDFIAETTVVDSVDSDLESRSASALVVENRETLPEKIQSNTPVHEIGVPKPPVFSVWEESIVPETPEKMSENIEEEIINEDGTTPGDQPEQKLGQKIYQSQMFWDTDQEKGLEEDAEEPMVFELELGEEPVENPSEPAKSPLVPSGNPHSIIPEGFLNMGTIRRPPEPEVVVREIKESVKVPATEVPARHRDLNELLAGRVVAKNETGLRETGVKALAETLGGSKINDLRKAISINDRFRFIHSLFRNDEVAFERAVKTINNFSILQEAQYWIQRELVIKLGWNDEDELVQQFYHLVSRRFL